jgi:glycosyltransferase involved in cell wall biosynthesis
VGRDSRTSGRIAILLSTFEGERFLCEQLDSFLAQTHEDWVLHWRDDSSTDRTVAIMQAFARGPGSGRCMAVSDPDARLGARSSYLRLLTAALDVQPGADAIAFADQDDVWLPDKLVRGYAPLAEVPPAVPALSCARQVLVDGRLQPLGLSPRISREAGFPAALTQNVATGCTVMLNPAAAGLVAASHPPPSTLHDWWSYLIVAAAGGRVLVDDVPSVLYRQHPANQVGAPASLPDRAAAALRRGPAAFMTLFRQHVAALEGDADLLSPQARAELQMIRTAMGGSLLDRGAVLTKRGLRRQTWQETAVFACWFMLG